MPMTGEPSRSTDLAPDWRSDTRRSSRTSSPVVSDGSGYRSRTRPTDSACWVSSMTARAAPLGGVGVLVGELIVSKSHYGDHITRRRRRFRSPWPRKCVGLLPPLTFTSPDVSIAGFLQPSHGIAGDAFDYAVNGRTASVAVFDAMGHGNEASRMANVAVGFFRNARRRGATR